MDQLPDPGVAAVDHRLAGEQRRHSGKPLDLRVVLGQQGVDVPTGKRRLRALEGLDALRRHLAREYLRNRPVRQGTELTAPRAHARIRI